MKIGILNQIFNRNPDKKLVANGITLERIWQAYEETIRKKIAEVETFSGMKSVQKLRLLLDNGLIDVRYDERLSDDIQSELYLRLHSRNIRSTKNDEMLAGALYDANTKYDYVHGLLAQLHVMLASQLHFVKDFLRRKLNEEQFLNKFRYQLELEDTLVNSIHENVGTFHDLLSDLVNKTHIVELPTRTEQEHYDRMKKTLHPLSFAKPPLGIIRAPGLADEARVVMDYVQKALEDFHNKGEYDEEEFYPERIYYWYWRFVNRPEFTGEAKAILEKLRGGPIPEAELLAFVRLFRERVNDSQPPHEGEF